MTRVCLLGDPDVDLRAVLFEYEIPREALAPFDLEEPFRNSIAVETVSLGTALSLLNDLNWYLVRFVDEAIVNDPSVSDTEWLSRPLARAVRNESIDPTETGEFIKVFGIASPEATGGRESGKATEGADSPAPPPDESTGAPTPRLTEPMFARRIGGEIPEYDLAAVEDTLVVRITREEFGRG